MSTNNNVLGLDLGMGAIKLWGAGGGVQVLSQVAFNGTTVLGEGVLGLKSKARPMQIRSASGSFYVGPGAHDYGPPVENLDFDRLTGTAEIRSLVYAALTQYAHEHHPTPGPSPFSAKMERREDLKLQVLVGLPFQMMTGDDADNFKKSVRKWMNGVHEWDADGEPFRVEIEVGPKGLVPQALGALFDFTHSDEGVLLPEQAWALKQEIGVLSIGFNTIELLVTQQMTEKGRFTTGIQMGVRRLLEDVNRELGGLYTLGELDMMLRRGALDIKRALPNWADRVTGAVEQRWGQTFKRFSRVLVVGGGAELLRDYLTIKFRGKAVVLDNPVLSIAHGLHKMTLRFKK